MADVMLTTYAAAQAIDGRASGADVGFARVTTDSRAVQAGDLFVALKGERFDAHDFVAGALAAGAAAALVCADFPELPGASLIRVEDTLAALGRLAAHWRTVGFAGRMAGITGSSGKTSVKEMLRAILVAEAGEDAVLATAGNLNNDIGVPLTLLRLRGAHRFAVIEMGMNHPGEIRYLASLARADAVAINNAQRAHAGHFASVADIARAKGELFESLPAGVTACVNLDDAYAGLWQTLAGDARQIGFGWSQGEVRVTDCQLHSDRVALTLATPLGPIAAEIPAPGEHVARNALTAVSLAIALGVSASAIAQGLSQFAGAPGRLQRKLRADGVLVLDDTYNANPDSMRAALRVLAAQPGARHAVLGDIGELGDGGPAMHAEVGAFARELGIDSLHGLGELSAHTVAAFGSGGQHYADLDALLAGLAPLLHAPATVLVKGSRFMRMERVSAALLGQAPAAAH